MAGIDGEVGEMGEALFPDDLADGPARADDGGRLAARIDRVEPGILDSIEKGNFPLVAAQAQGVPQRTWNDWRARADRGEARPVELFERVSCALAKAELELVEKLRNPPMGPNGADNGWIRATQFLLERTRRERWGDKVEVRVKVEDSLREMMSELESLMSPDAFAELVLALSQIEHDAGEG